MSSSVEVHIDELSAGFVSGWARRPDDVPADLELHTERGRLATTAAVRYRRDLAEAGIGSGLYGFAFILNESVLQDGEVVRIQAADGTLLLETTFAPASRSDLRWLFELAATVEQPAGPYWRAEAQLSGSTVSIRGPLCTPRSVTRIECKQIMTNEVVEIAQSSASPEVEERFWFLKGEISWLSCQLPSSEERQVVQLTGSNALDFFAVPSRNELASFIFPGQERATRVAGGNNVEFSFASSGLTEAIRLNRLVERWLDMQAPPRVFDWGSGPGRVLQWLRVITDWSLTGGDIDAVNIDWAKAMLGHIADFRLLPLMPPCDLADASQDFVYGLSVLTHLTEAARTAWLQELARILRPGGVALLTYMGTGIALQGGRHASALASFEPLATTGYSDIFRDYALGEELSEYYRATFNTQQNLLAAIDRDFTLCEVLPRSFCHQDALVLRRRR